MAGNNNIAQQIQFLTYVLFAVKTVRLFCFCYSFLTFLFWFLNCFEIDWLYLFTWLFIIPYKIVAVFYTPEGISADFSLVIIGIICLVIGFVFDFIRNTLYQKLDDLEEEEEQIILRRKQIKQREHRNKKPLPSYGDDVSLDSIENTRLIFLMHISVSKIRPNLNIPDLNFQEIELWKQRVNKKVLEMLKVTQPLKRGYYRKNIFVLYKSFSYSDSFLDYLVPEVDIITTEFANYGISLKFNYVLSSIVRMEDLEKELDCMDTIFSLGFSDELIATVKYKNSYSRNMRQKNTLVLKGEYNLSKNLSRINRQALYEIQRKERGI